jgi:hypothetical protein
MKPRLTPMVAAAILITAVSLAYISLSSRSSGDVDAARILAAAQAYARNLRAQGSPVPPAVNLEELISRGLLRRADVQGFDEAEVTVALNPSGSRPNDILMRARLPDSHEIVALADGSVQSVGSKLK